VSAAARRSFLVGGGGAPPTNKNRRRRRRGAAWSAPVTNPEFYEGVKWAAELLKYFEFPHCNCSILSRRLNKFLYYFSADSNQLSLVLKM
jgi:hypothetical protein